MKNQEEVIEEYFSTIRNNNTKVNSFFSFLDAKNIQYAVLGGAFRAALDSSYSLRDIDLIYKTDFSIVLNYLSENNIKFKKNSFDGLKFNLDNIQFDVWDIENHFAFKNNYYKLSFKNVCKTTFLNYDSIMYDFTNQILYCEDYQTCINSKVLDLVGGWKLNNNNPNRPLSICKIFEIKKEKKLSLSNKTKKYIRKYISFYGNNIKDCLCALRNSYEIHYYKKMNKNLSIYIRKQLKEILNK